MPRCNNVTQCNKNTGKRVKKTKKQKNNNLTRKYVAKWKEYVTKKKLNKQKKQENTKKMVDVIIFNSKSKEYYELSNFYGGVEICFMKDRFYNPEIKALFDEFETCDREKFIYYLKKLQPGKKWTDAKLEYWFKNGEPIRGILAKLLGGAVKPGPTGRKRLKIIKDMLELKEDISIKNILSHDEKIELMLKCLKEKYNIPKYKCLLLSTGNKILHEKPMRGKGDDWTYPGGDLLGILLMRVRSEFRN